MLIAVDLFKRDAEYSLLLGCSAAEQQSIQDFSNSGAMRVYLVPRRPDRNALFHGRRSVRRFRDDPIPEDILAQVLEAATLAPSAHNSQPWRFAVLASREVKERLAQAMGADFLRDLTGDGVQLEEARRQVQRSQERILGAPVAVVLCLDRSVEDLYPDAAPAGRQPPDDDPERRPRRWEPAPGGARPRSGWGVDVRPAFRPGSRAPGAGLA